LKERPIIFSAPMVRAILDGRKWQTRRIVKPQPDTVLEGYPYWHIGGFRLRKDAANPLRCPYGVIGDRLWVKETADHVSSCGYNVPNAEHELRYCADEKRHKFVRPEMGPYGFLRKVSSMFMPRWASRITLEVTEVIRYSLGIEQRKRRMGCESLGLGFELQADRACHLMARNRRQNPVKSDMRLAVFGRSLSAI